MSLFTFLYKDTYHASLSLYSVGTLITSNLCNTLTIHIYTPPSGPAWGVLTLPEDFLSDVQTDVHFVPIDSVCS